MASAEHEPITGFWGQSPQRGPGAEPLVRGSGGSPPEAESILVIGCPTEPANLAPVRENSMLFNGPLVSELGAQSAWCPQPRHSGGLCPLYPSGSAAYVFVQCVGQYYARFVAYHPIPTHGKHCCQ